MRLHSLTLSNVGPFPGSTTIDFSSLGTNGLFLMDGPTGAGKSTIIDSIVFALYGQVAGSYASPERMKSQFAAAGAEPAVELTFETTAGVFRIQRTPAYQRPKQRGDGTTAQQATVKLFRLTAPGDAGELLSNRPAEADDEIRRIIGLNREQLVQTVVLPQGEFANFLRAPADDRRALLQKIFGTQLYDGLCQQLEAARKEALARRQVALERSAHSVTAFVTAAHCAPELAEELAELTPEQLSSRITLVLDELKESAQQAVANLATVDQELEASTAAVAQAQDLVRRLTKRAEFLARQQRLAEQQPAQAQRVAQIQLLRRVSVAAPFAEAVRSAAARTAAAQDAFSQALIRANEQVGEQSLDDPARTAKTLSDQAEQLAHLVELEQELLLAETELTKELAALAAAESELALLNDEAAALPGQIEALDPHKEQLVAAAARIPHLEHELLRAKARLAAAREANVRAEQLHGLTQNVQQLHDEARKSASELAYLQRARIDGIAGELAGGLAKGDPCPVCGSKAHPRPAMQPLAHPTPVEIEMAQSRLESAATQLERARSKHEEMASKVAALLATSEGFTPDTAEIVAKELAGDLDDARAARSDLQRTASQLIQLESRLERLQDQVTTKSAQVAVSHERVAAMHKSIKSGTRKVSKGRQGFASVSEHVADLQRRSAALQALTQAAENRNVAESELALRDSELAAILTELELSAAELAAGAPQLKSVNSLVTEAELYEKEQAVVLEGLASADLQDLAGVPAPAIDQLTAGRDGAAAAQRQAAAHASTAVAIFERTAALGAKAEKARAQLQKITVETQPIVRLAEVANATSPANLAKIPLPAYVLMSRFRDVVAAANRRLEGMSGGRFELRHSSQRESKGRKSGLGLHVHDYVTDSLRSPGDLSGGETFYTALALALGLADVVSAEAGGVELGTLFIDEGFGALDNETLDSVLHEIARLRSGGRVVGLVSHVEELKQRIPERVEVRRSADGSSTVRVVC